MQTDQYFRAMDIKGRRGWGWRDGGVGGGGKVAVGGGVGGEGGGWGWGVGWLSVFFRESVSNSYLRPFKLNTLTASVTPGRASACS